MRLLAVLLTAFLGVVSFHGDNAPPNRIQTSDCRCVTDALSEIDKIKVGMKRKDLDAIFSPDGGISSPFEQRFVYKNCAIKVQIKFKFVEKDKKFPENNAEDIIVEISKPYLEHPFYD